MRNIMELCQLHHGASWRVASDGHRGLIPAEVEVTLVCRVGEEASRLGEVGPGVTDLCGTKVAVERHEELDDVAG